MNHVAQASGELGSCWWAACDAVGLQQYARAVQYHALSLARTDPDQCLCLAGHVGEKIHVRTPRVHCSGPRKPVFGH